MRCQILEDYGPNVHTSHESWNLSSMLRQYLVKYAQIWTTDRSKLLQDYCHENYHALWIVSTTMLEWDVPNIPVHFPKASTDEFMRPIVRRSALETTGESVEGNGRIITLTYPIIERYWSCGLKHWLLRDTLLNYTWLSYYSDNGNLTRLLHLEWCQCQDCESWTRWSSVTDLLHCDKFDFVLSQRDTLKACR